MAAGHADFKERKIWIPKVPKERIVQLARSIKPVINFPDKGLFYIESVHLFDVAYTWDPKSSNKAIGLKKICDIRTYHTFSHYACFKPSIAEVLAQIPEAHLGKAVAFEIVKCPETAEDLNLEKEALDSGYHVASTRLYFQEHIPE